MYEFEYKSDANKMPCDLKRFTVFFDQHCRKLVSSSAGENRMELAFKEMSRLTRDPVSTIKSVSKGVIPPTASILNEMGWAYEDKPVIESITVTKRFYRPKPEKYCAWS